MEKSVKDCEIEGNISGISSLPAHHLLGSSQTPLMKFWKRSVILRIFDLIVKIEIGVMFVMIYDSESNPKLKFEFKPSRIEKLAFGGSKSRR